jgi:hypothetical protein
VTNMSVMGCDRKGCEMVMCHRHNRDYGYICHECFQELLDSTLDVEDVMVSKKDSNREIKKEARELYLNKLFPHG